MFNKSLKFEPFEMIEFIRSIIADVAVVDAGL